MHFELEKKNESGDDKFDIFVIFTEHILSQIYKASFDFFFSFGWGWGLGPSCPLSGYATANEQKQNVCLLLLDI